MTTSLRSLAIVLILAAPQFAPAQPAVPPFVEVSEEVSSYPERDRARGRFAAAQADPRFRLLDMSNAARVQYIGRCREFLPGRGTLDFLLASLHRLREAELFLSETPVDRSAVHEMIWAQAREIEDINRARYFQGRVAIQDLAEAEDYRLEAEMVWHQARVRSAKAPGIPQSLRPLGLLDDLTYAELSVVDARRRARARFASFSADPKDVVRQWLKAAEVEQEARFKEYLAGRGTLDFNLGAARRLLLAGCAAYSEPTDQLPFFERYWLQVRVMEWINQARYDAGRLAIQDVLQSTKERATAELALLEARAKAPGKQPAPCALRGEILENLVFDYPGSGRTQARMKYEPGTKTRQELARIRRDAASGEVDARHKEFLVGRGTLHFLLQSALSLLEAERGLRVQSADLERHWTLMWQIETINSDRCDQGRVTFKDLAESRFHRIEAELWLAQQRAKGKP